MHGQLTSAAGHLPYHAGHFGVLASLAAFEDGSGWLDALVGTSTATARLLADLLAEQLPAVGYVPPQAGYLAWLDCRALGLGDDPVRGLPRARPGGAHRRADFGEQGKGFARLNFGTSSALSRRPCAAWPPL